MRSMFKIDSLEDRGRDVGEMIVRDSQNLMVNSPHLRHLSKHVGPVMTPPVVQSQVKVRFFPSVTQVTGSQVSTMFITVDR